MTTMILVIDLIITLFMKNMIEAIKDIIKPLTDTLK